MTTKNDAGFAQTARLILRLANQIQTVIELRFDDTRLSLARAGLLAQLRGGPVPFGDLADRLHCGKSNMTSMIDRCERDGFVRRVKDSRDRRVNLAELTEAGHQAAQHSMRVMEEFDSDLRESLGSHAEIVLEALSRLALPE